MGSKTPRERSDAGAEGGLLVTLQHPLPEALEVGRGSVLLLQGRCSWQGRPPGGLEVLRGERSFEAIAHGMPLPGTFSPGDWWWALVPIEPVPSVEHAGLRLRVRLPGGGSATAGLGTIRLEPGPAEAIPPRPERLDDLIPPLAAGEGEAATGRRASSLREWIRDAPRAVLHRDWRSAYFSGLLPLMQEARALELRLSGALSRREARILRRLGRAERSPRAVAWLIARQRRARDGRRRAEDEAGRLLRALAWRWLARPRSRWIAARQSTASAARRRAARRRIERAAAATARPLVATAPGLAPRWLRRIVHVPASPRRAARLQARLEASLPAPERTEGPRVTAVIPSRDGRHHLERLMPALEETAYRPLEVVVVDNASTDGSASFLRDLSPGFPLRVLQGGPETSFSAANNLGLRESEGELVLLLNNDVEPATPGWLGRMVGTLLDREAAAVGARLVYPRRPRVDNAGDDAFPDLTIQHRGIGFRPDPDGIPRPRNLGAGEDPLGARAAEVREVPAVTAACALLRRDALEAVGGLSADYRFGTEDVDLCLRLRERGERVVYDGGAVLYHHEFGTQNAAGREAKRRNRLRNRELFVDRWGPRVAREVLADRIRGAGHWSEEPLRVAITVTRDDERTGAGDYYTAHELGDALAELGYEVSYVERHRHRWLDIDPATDVIVALLDGFPLHEAPPNAVSIAWVRNWTERWIEQPWFEDYDIVFASSARSAEIIEERTSKVAHLLPLATNPARFGAAEPDPELACDLLFTGHLWGTRRDLTPALPHLDGSTDVKVYGHGWESVPEVAPHHHGSLAYGRLPAAYAAARVVLDDTAVHTKPYDSVNSRVFDALAAGTPVLSNNPEGLRELFGAELPTWSDGPSLAAGLRSLLADEERTRELVDRYRRIVLEQHTYGRRAEQIRDRLLAWCEAPRFGISIGVPRREEVETWGDYHFARAVQRQLERRGHPTRVHLLPQWEDAVTAREDVRLHLLGLSELRTRPGQLNVLWCISHPDLLTPELVERYDVAFIASTPFAAELSARVGIPVFPLHQATDPRRFFPQPDGEGHELLFVGGSRRVRRRIVDDITPTERDLAIYGPGWTPDLVDPRYVAGERLPNAELRRHYSSAAIVLNDHWDDMRARGFLSNRLYDALAAGACVVSDHVEGIEEELDGAVVTYTDADDLRRKVDALLADPARRRELAERGRARVLAAHTFEHRVDELLARLEQPLAARPRGVTARRRAKSSAGRAGSANQASEAS